MPQKSHLIDTLYDQYWAGKKEIAPLSEEWARVMLDVRAFAANHIIIDKEGHAIPFILNEAQEALMELIIKHTFAKIPEPVDIVVLKSRQMGISTILALVEQYIACRKRNINALHILPTEELANNFYVEKVEPLWEGTNPVFMPDAYATVTPTPYIKVRKFAGHDMNVNIRFTGGNSQSAGRSSTNGIIFGDEWAFQANVKRLERGILATRPKTGLALTAYISTANGKNHFYDIWQQALKPESRIKHLFLPWHMLKEYEKDPTPESKYWDLNRWKPDTYDARLIEEFSRLKYPKESWVRKLAWYEDVLINEAKGDLEHMQQEYPSFETESFDVTGSPVFPSKVINHWLSQPDEFTPLGIVETVNGVRTEITFEEIQRSGIHRYKEPEIGHRYSIGVDAATNVVGGDYSAGVVIDDTTMEEVCSFNLSIDQNDLAELVVALARYYNKARVIPERNMGELFIDTATRVLGYYNFYVDAERSTRHKTVYGVRITAAKKREAIRRMRFLMLNGLYKAHDRIFMEQMQHYSYKQLPSGEFKAEASGTNENGEPWHDDAIAARYPWVLSLNWNMWKNFNGFNRFSQSDGAYGAYKPYKSSAGFVKRIVK